MMEYHWYKIIEGDNNINQGDLIYQCPILIPPSKIPIEKEMIVDIDVKISNVIVMSQSCDLIYGKIKFVLVCPFISLTDFVKSNPDYNSIKAKNKLLQGHYPGYHLLNKCEEKHFEPDFLIVNFRDVFGVDFSFLREFIKTKGRRLRLLPPYREHLSQAFARFFMRVGLPADIPAFT